VHLPERIKNLGDKFTEGIVSAPLGRECTPGHRQRKSPIFFRKMGRFGGGSGYLRSFSVCFEGYD